MQEGVQSGRPDAVFIFRGGGDKREMHGVRDERKESVPRAWGPTLRLAFFPNLYFFFFHENSRRD